MKKKLMSLLLAVALVLSLCPAALAAGTNTAEVGKLTLVYGEKNLPDEDAFVLLILGDGFTADEQGKFYEEAGNTAEYIMNCSPYDEFTDTIKIYALGVTSNESGATGANATSAAGVANDKKDTYFGASFWTWGMQRLLDLSEEGKVKAKDLWDEYLPLADFCICLVNSDVYGGSGGDFAVASLNAQSNEIAVHEMGHSVAGLADEYYAEEYKGEYANLTADPDNVPWSRFIGKNGIGVYDWGSNSESGYYIPSQSCKMHYLGEEYEFCEVCKEEIRKAICKYSNVTKIFFQTYADEFIAGKVPDMKQYFILRKGEHEVTGDQLDSLRVCFYYDNDYHWDNSPTSEGSYYVCAYFTGATVDGVKYDKLGSDGYSDWFEFSIDSFTYAISLEVSSKVNDGTPAELTYTVKPLTDEYREKLESGEYVISIDYYVNPYSSKDTYYYGDLCNGSHQNYEVYYQSGSNWKLLSSDAGAPSVAGEYTVTLSVMDKKWNTIASKSATYAITLDSTRIIDNNDSNYYGAYSYGNNKNVVIYGEGFTQEEQGKFNELAQELTKGILTVEPIKEAQLYFNFISVNTVSNESGVGAGKAKDTFFGLAYNTKTGAIMTDASHCDDSTYNAARICYSFASTNEGAVCIIIVNDENVTACSTYAPYAGTQKHYRQAIYVTPNDADWTDYAAAEILNYLTMSGPGYRAETEEAKAEQRLDLIAALHTEYAPVIVSNAYSFIANGKPVDLEPYFHVYYEGEELSGVELALTYYDAKGNELSGAPSKPGTYSVLAETVPDPDFPEWTWYQPEGWTDEEGMWLGSARGYLTFTIKDYYYDAVQWAMDEGITTASSIDGFSPSDSCNRAQAVTFLWRAAGSPEPESTVNPFTDIKESDYFYKAVLWAVEQGITNGTSNTTFSPSASCSRAQIVTFLWRMDGAEEVSAANPFTDVAGSAFYANSVLWAVENGITTGATTTTFSPNTTCSRAHIITFLYRYLAE